MSEKLAKRHAELEAVLGTLSGDRAFDELEDRAYDSGHLEEEHFEVLLGASRSGELDDHSVVNLKRHVLFCDLCSQQFLQRVGPAAEAHYAGIEEVEIRRRYLRGVLLFGIPLLALIGWLVWWSFGGNRPAPSAPDEPAPEASFPVRPTRAGRGAALGVSGPAGRRLFLELEGPREARVFAYVFLTGEGGMVQLHPPPSGGGNPVGPGLVPEGGWNDPGAGPPRHLLVLLAEEPVLLLEAPGRAADTVAALRRRLSGGATLEQLRQVLLDLPGAGAAGAWVKLLVE